jgi:hypothetical protein
MQIDQIFSHGIQPDGAMNIREQPHIDLTTFGTGITQPSHSRRYVVEV